jgi:23S rRNA pseudouridine2604 synthase
MSNGVKILDTVTKKCTVKQESKNRFRIILVQGLNRQIRRMCQVLGYNVNTLKRVRIMNITIANLPVGKWRYFTTDEIQAIESSLTSSIKTEDGSYFE